MSSSTPTRQSTDRPRHTDEVEVRVSAENFFYGGEAFSDWTSVEVSRSMFNASGSFKIKAAHRQPWPMRPDTGVEIWIGGELVLTGFVDGVESSVDGDSKSLSFAGRDNTAILVDATQENSPGEWRKLTVKKIVEAIASPFKVKVSTIGQTADGEADVIDLFRVNPGEKAWSAIERVLRLRGYLAYAVGDGTLRISSVGQNYADAELVEGPDGNIQKSKVTWSHMDRYSVYKVLAQADGGDDAWGTAVLAAEGRAWDDNVRRFRPLTIVGDVQMSPEASERAAQWEASYRAAKSGTLTVTIGGWKRTLYSGEQKLWRVNELLHCEIPSQNFRRQMLIDSVAYKRDDAGGTRSILTLVRKDAYDPKPTVDEETESFSNFLGEDLE